MTSTLHGPGGSADEHPPIQCLLELRYDGTVGVVTKRGCTDQDIYETLRQLAEARWSFQQHDSGATSCHQPDRVIEHHDYPNGPMEGRDVSLGSGEREMSFGSESPC